VSTPAVFNTSWRSTISTPAVARAAPAPSKQQGTAMATRAALASG
jgi:hypothetical protein